MNRRGPESGWLIVGIAILVIGVCVACLLVAYAWFGEWPGDG